MIDIENDVFSLVAAELRSEYAGVWVSGDYVAVPARFPAVIISEANNRVYEMSRTSSKRENAATVMYECKIYSNKVNNKHQEARAIAKTLDAKMDELGFTRTFMSPIPNLLDASVFQIICRYEAVIVPNADGKFYVHTN